MRQMEYDVGISRSQIETGLGLLSCGQKSLFRVMILPSESFIVLYSVQNVLDSKN